MKDSQDLKTKKYCTKVELKEELQEFLQVKFQKNINYNAKNEFEKEQNIKYLLNKYKNSQLALYNFDFNYFYYYLLQNYDTIANKAKKYIINNNLYKNINIFKILENENQQNFLRHKKISNLTYLLLSIFFK